jgi:hypothetical protein
MSPPTDDEFQTSAMVDAVRDMSRKLDNYTRHADQERDKLLASVNGTVEAMRKDVYRAIISLQLNASQHKDEHTAERKERAADAIERVNRQLTVNLWMGALTVMVVINLLLIGFVVVRVVLVAYGQ